MAPHAYVRFCLDGEKKLVPTSWFKDGFEDPTNYDPAKAYLVFYSPGDVQTPESLLRKVSKIPVFETANDLDRFTGPDPSGFYRATVCFAGNSINDVMDYISTRRVKSVPLNRVKETSFEKAQREQQPSSSKQGSFKSSSGNVKAICHKKGKVQPSSEHKRLSTRSNVNALKQKLIAMDANNPVEIKGSSSANHELKDSSRNRSTVVSQQNESLKEKMKHNTTGSSQKQNKEDRQKQITKARKEDGPQSTKVEKPVKVTNVNQENKSKCISKAPMSKDDGHVSFNQRTRNDSTLPKADFILTSPVDEGTHHSPEENMSSKDPQPISRAEFNKSSAVLSIKDRAAKVKKRSHHHVSNSSDSDSDNSDDCFVSMDDHQKLVQLLKQKEAEVHQLQQSNKKLRKYQDNPNDNNYDVHIKDPRFEKDDMIINSDSEAESQKEENDLAPDNEKKSDIGKNNLVDKEEAKVTVTENKSDENNIEFPTDENRPEETMENNTDKEKQDADKNSTIGDDFAEEIKVFSDVKVTMCSEKLQDLRKIAPGQKSDKPYVKLAAQLMWGSKHLREHSTDGRRNPKDITSTPRPALDKTKMEAIRELLIIRVRRESDPKATYGARCSLPTVKRYIGEKIQSLISSDLRQAAKQQMQQQK